MYPTAEQADAVQELQRAYGPATVKHEQNSEPYGLVWLTWPHTLLTTVTGYRNDRNLFVRPDGTRLSWETQL